jgi:sterol desaturase/sphingolipid hydroxylase (fatty acid hydroxylase superfamily)
MRGSDVRITNVNTVFYCIKENVYYFYNMSDINTYVTIPFACSFFVYWSISGYYFLRDYYGDLSQRIDTNIDWMLYKKTFYHVLYLQFCFSLPIMYMLIPVWKWRNNTILFESIEYIDIIKLGVNGLLGESIFYYMHYWSHFILYSKIHKVHHEWTNTCALAAAYAHPVEFMLVNLPSFLIPPIITGSNWFITNLWFMIATTSVVIDHSGYKNIHYSEFHWKHHKSSNANYGTNTIGDIVLLL